MSKEFTSKKAQLKYAESLETALENIKDDMSYFAAAVAEFEGRVKTGRRGKSIRYSDKSNRELYNQCVELKSDVQGDILTLTGLDPENKSIPGYEVHFREYCEKLEQLEPYSLQSSPSEVAGSWFKKILWGIVYVLIFFFLLAKCVF